MKIGVIGATGGARSPLVKPLIDAGHDVRGIVRRDADEDKVRAAGAEATALDLTQAEQDAQGTLSGLDAVINAAAARSTSGGQARAVDRDGVKATIDAAKKAGVRR